MNLNSLDFYSSQLSFNIVISVVYKSQKVIMSPTWYRSGVVDDDVSGCL